VKVLSSEGAMNVLSCGGTLNSLSSGGTVNVASSIRYAPCVHDRSVPIVSIAALAALMKKITFE
jgi:hypothetical protein